MATNGKVLRILIVEDEALIAMHLEDALIALGHHVAGMAARLDDALALARDAVLDFAVLDIRIIGGPSFPVADVLRGRGIPFFFASGFGREGLPAEYQDALILRKPYDVAELERMIAKLPHSGPPHSGPPHS
ncbi:MAG: response regulator [Acetobacteraceae bacterium]